MKTQNLLVVAVIVAVVIGAGAGYLAARSKYKAMLAQKDAFIMQEDSQLKSLQAKDAQMNKQQSLLPDGVMMKEGKMWQVKSGQTSAMSSEMTMSDGTKVDSTGKVTMKDGSIMMMKDGEKMTMDGKVTDSATIGK